MMRFLVRATLLAALAVAGGPAQQEGSALSREIVAATYPEGETVKVDTRSGQFLSRA